MSGVFRRTLPLALLVVGLSGCAGEGPVVTEPGSDFERIQREIFSQSCLSAACHNSQSRAGNMNLSEGVSYDQLVGQVPDNLVARQEGLLRVDPLRPENSFILIKLRDPALGQGSRMPLGEDPLPPSDIELIEKWIMDGAPRGTSDTPTPTMTVVPATATPTMLSTPTLTSTDTPTATPTVPTPTGTREATATPSSTPTPSPTATPSASPSPTFNPDATLEEIQGTIFTPTCAVSICHSTAARAGELVLEEGLSFDHLVGVEPFNTVAAGAGLLRVDPGNPDNSFLLVKLQNPPIALGSPMPLIGEPLTAQEILLIRDWIAQGAAP